MPERKEIYQQYKGELTPDQQRKILDLCFFVDTVQHNGGFKEFEENLEQKTRQKQRIMEALLNAGISVQDVNKYMEIFV